MNDRILREVHEINLAVDSLAKNILDSKIITSQQVAAAVSALIVEHFQEVLIPIIGLGNYCNNSLITQNRLLSQLRTIKLGVSA